MKKPRSLFPFLMTLILISAISCSGGGSSNSDSVQLQLDSYEDAVAKVAPNDGTKGNQTSTTGRALISGKATVDSILPAAISGVTSLKRQWVGWDNETLSGAMSYSGKDGWMPFMEEWDSVTLMGTGNYIDNTSSGSYGSSNNTPDGIPDRKDYAVLNKVFFGSGMDTIYGGPEFIDEIASEIAKNFNPDFTIKSGVTGMTINPVASGSITVPAWFGKIQSSASDPNVYSTVPMDYVIDPTAYLTALGSNNNCRIGIRLVKNGDIIAEQAILMYSDMINGNSRDIMVFYGRKDQNDAVYIKSAFASYKTADAGVSWTWDGGHASELRTSGTDFIVRKANKLPAIQAGGDPNDANNTYTHCLIGGGSIDTSSYFILRWLENKYPNSISSTDADTKIATNDYKVGTSGDRVRSSDIYFVINYDSTQDYNAKFKPLLGKGAGPAFNPSGDAALLPELVDESGVTYFADKPACKNYTNINQYPKQAEIPGDLSTPVTAFTDLTWFN